MGDRKMRIVQDKKTGAGEIQFSWREVWILIKRRKFTFSTPEDFKHFLNEMVQQCFIFNGTFDDRIQKLKTDSSNRIKINSGVDFKLKKDKD
jgi:hypothetical protein|tara:strand:- start:268 stop:543 length:276 start_codon:yes stop_codon:yes gene_type:complete